MSPPEMYVIQAYTMQKYSEKFQTTFLIYNKKQKFFLELMFINIA